MTEKKELCSTQPIFHPKENVSVDTLKNVEVNEVTQVEDYWSETVEGLEVLHIEPEITIALNEVEENEIRIKVISGRLEEPHIEIEEDQPLVLVKPPTLPCTFDSFVLEVPNELLSLKEGVHASLPKYVDAPFIVDISKREGIT
ncbi:hypothetical protein Scep_002098 [Stephania cephalantha]|uniref:Uncharacterized protein n=1 Tax=Stephania cephalantha TaxID=152367 RepID=A0AAP0LAT0_9MAGN